MFFIKRLKCSCCGVYFRRAGYYYIEDQMFFFNKYHKYRWEKNRVLTELTLEESAERIYNKPGNGNLP